MKLKNTQPCLLSSSLNDESSSVPVDEIVSGSAPENIRKQKSVIGDNIYLFAKEVYYPAITVMDNDY